MTRKRIDPQLRFFAKVSKRGHKGCWKWNGALVSTGYGNFWDGKRAVGAHVWSFLHAGGIIPPGMELDHTCGNRWCVNPDHLDPVTHQENIRRSLTAPPAIHARKTHCPRGHAYSGDNLIVEKAGNRKCRTCKNERRRKNKGPSFYEE